MLLRNGLENLLNRLCSRKKILLENAQLKNDNLVLSDQLTVLNSRMAIVMADLNAHVKAVPDAESIFLKGLSAIVNDPVQWHHCLVAVNNHFKADVATIPVDKEAYSNWYGKLQGKIIKHSGYKIDQRDTDYWTFSNKENARKAISSLWTFQLNYKPERWDCDDDATLFRVAMNMIYGVNNVAYVESEWNNGRETLAHAWNILWCPDGALKIEPRILNDMEFDAKVPDPYQTGNIRTYIR